MMTLQHLTTPHQQDLMQGSLEHGGLVQAPQQSFWEQRTALEKVGVVAIGAVGAVAAVAILAPGLLASSAGGALAGAGAWLLKKGLTRT